MTIIFLFCVASGAAQIIDNGQCQAFTDETFFNAEFICTNKVKSIKGTIQTKAQMDRIRDRGLETFYGFDSTGRQIIQYSTYLRYSNTKDTTVINYYYDDQGRICTQRRNDVHGFYSYNYEYDSLGRMIKESYCRDENVGPNKSSFELGNQYVIVSEEYGYEQIDETHMKRSFYNNNGLVYQEEVSHYDENGYLTDITTKLIIGKRGSKITFEYDEHGRVSRKTDYANLDVTNEIMTEYQYDEIGNLIMIDEYRNGVHITNKELLYDEKTMLFDAMITLDVETNYITIIKYEYEFF